VGRISAELVAPYPPGVPVLAPGEVVTEQVVAALQSARAAGVRIAYAADPQLSTLDVVARANPHGAIDGDTGSR
jgi:lysine decarboxylase